MAFLGILFFAFQAAASTPVKHAGRVRHYYIAAEDVTWDYAPTGRDLLMGQGIPSPYTQTRWQKTRYFQYTDATFTKQVPQPRWLGILGPIIRAEVGDTIKVLFLNRSQSAHSIHPHGLRYEKASEGALYLPLSAGASVSPGARFEYTWFADAESGPGPGDGDSIAWWYHPHVHEESEANKGLLGPIIITRAGHAKADATPRDVDQEIVAAFMIFDEMNGKEAGLMHAINGYIFGNLPGIVLQQGQKVRWHLLAMGNERDIHTPHWHGKTVLYGRRRTDVIELLPASMISVTMNADNPGTWLFHCQVSDHMESGMMATYTIRATPRPCPLLFTEGDFWQKQAGKSRLTVKNASGKAISAFALTAEAFQHPDYVVPASQFNQNSSTVLQPGRERTFQLADSTAATSAMLGWIYYPSHITFADGATWKPREKGECFRTFWRDKNHPEMPVKPVTQYDSEGIDE